MNPATISAYPLRNEASRPQRVISELGRPLHDRVHTISHPSGGLRRNQVTICVAELGPNGVTVGEASRHGSYPERRHTRAASRRAASTRRIEPGWWAGPGPCGRHDRGPRSESSSWAVVTALSRERASVRKDVSAATGYRTRSLGVTVTEIGPETTSSVAPVARACNRYSSSARS